MAELPVARPGHSSGPKRAKKASTRIDFTPMVDLGFLLITFFMLTTVLAKPQILAMVMPDDKGDLSDPIPESKTLTLILGAGNKVFWYEGITSPTLDSTDYSAGGLRQVIRHKMDKVELQWGKHPYRNVKTQAEEQGSFLYVLIKPLASSKYQNLVDAIDEMAINQVRYYVVMDPSLAEQEFVRRPSAGLAWVK